MSNTARIKAVQAAIDDAIRKCTAEFIEEVAIEDAAPGDLVLCDWVLMTHWVEPDDGEDGDLSWYHQLNSPGLSPHAAIGLLRVEND